MCVCVKFESMLHLKSSDQFYFSSFCGFFDCLETLPIALANEAMDRRQSWTTSTDDDKEDPDKVYV